MKNQCITHTHTDNTHVHLTTFISVSIELLLSILYTQSIGCTLIELSFKLCFISILFYSVFVFGIFCLFTICLQYTEHYVWFAVWISSKLTKNQKKKIGYPKRIKIVMWYLIINWRMARQHKAWWWWRRIKNKYTERRNQI